MSWCGDLLVTISATGTVEPEEVVDVGAQVAGQILSFGKDANGKTVDYGSPVEAGTILAKIDDSLYSAERPRPRHRFSRPASLQRAEADLEQLKAKLNQAERDWQRAQKLGPSEALSQSTYDAYRSAYETAERPTSKWARRRSCRPRPVWPRQRLLLRRAQRNLGYCTIKSPVKGVIIDRRVNIGQTVVASLNAPSLFLIAKDLTRMQVWVAVNEADIGRSVRPAGEFTVDAFPARRSRAKWARSASTPRMTQNVVTYTRGEIVTDNSEAGLLPYLTANVQFEVDRRTTS